MSRHVQRQDQLQWWVGRIKAEREDSTVATIVCRKHPNEPGPALPKAPFKGARGERILAEICDTCWKKWIEHQTILMNHFGLDPRDKKAKAFLYAQLDAILFDEGEPAMVDTSQKGLVGW